MLILTPSFSCNVAHAQARGDVVPMLLECATSGGELNNIRERSRAPEAKLSVLHSDCFDPGAAPCEGICAFVAAGVEVT